MTPRRHFFTRTKKGKLIRFFFFGRKRRIGGVAGVQIRKHILLDTCNHGFSFLAAYLGISLVMYVLSTYHHKYQIVHRDMNMQSSNAICLANLNNQVKKKDSRYDNNTYAIQSLSIAIQHPKAMLRKQETKLCVTSTWNASMQGYPP